MSCTAREFLSNLSNFTKFPTKKDESWRFSQLNKWLDKEYDFNGALIVDKNPIVKSPYIIEVHNGKVEKSTIPDGITIGDFKTQLDSDTNPFLKILGDINSKTVTVTCSKSIDKPILINYLYDSNSIISSSLNIKIQDGVDVEIIQYFYGGNDSFIIHSSSIDINNNAFLRLNSVQNLFNEAAFISHCRENLQIKSSVKEFYLFHGSGFHHNFIESYLHDESSNSLNVLINSKNKQHHLLSTFYKHLDKNTKSFQNSKELLRDNSMALFDAHSVIMSDAIHSDVRQENRALLLSMDAHLYAKPHMEIFTDELSASHGATVGELNKEAINYLEMRGISRAKARKILTDAFLDDLLLNLDNEELVYSIRNLLNEGVYHV